MSTGQGGSSRVQPGPASASASCVTQSRPLPLCGSPYGCVHLPLCGFQESQHYRESRKIERFCLDGLLGKLRPNWTKDLAGHSYAVLPPVIQKGTGSIPIPHGCSKLGWVPSRLHSTCYGRNRAIIPKTCLSLARAPNGSYTHNKMIH